jgi:hypothetical protein
MQAARQAHHIIVEALHMTLYMEEMEGLEQGRDLAAPPQLQAHGTVHIVQKVKVSTCNNAPQSTPLFPSHTWVLIEPGPELSQHSTRNKQPQHSTRNKQP